MTERLDRLETLSETILLAIQQQQGQIGDLRASIVDVVGMITDITTNIHEMQSEVRGLQTENRRILERLERRDLG